MVKRATRWLAMTFVIILVVADCRIGEAANPGPPPRGGDPAGITWADATWRDFVSYPRPHRDGFRDVVAPGYADEGTSREEVTGQEEFRLVVETVNSTGWGPLRRRLEESQAHIVLAQEHWILPDQLASASDWTRRHGWEGVWAPAAVGPGGGASGGVAILGRVGMGIRYPPVGPHILEEARAVAAFAEPPGHRPVLLSSVYLRDGRGMGEENRGTLAKIGECADRQGTGCLVLVGGDFQCSPEQTDGGGFPARIHGRVVAARSKRGTFRGGGAASTLDYYVATSALASAVEEVRLLEGTGVKGHVPVELRFGPRPVAMKTLTIRRPPDLEMEPVYGPRPPPQDWAPVKAAAARALCEAASGEADEVVQREVDAAYAAWCRTAEEEVVDATGALPKKWGMRGQRPRIKWASVLPETCKSRGPSAVAVATWLRGFGQELARVMGIIADGIGAGLYVDPWPQGSNRPHGATFATPVRGGYGGPPAGASSAAAARGGRPRARVELKDCVDIAADIVRELEAERGRADVDDITKRRRTQLAEVACRVRSAADHMVDHGYYADDSLVTDLRDIVTDLTDEEKAFETARAAEDRRGWKEWVEADWQRGARRAHAATKVPIEWKPTTAVDESGVISASPLAILEAARTKYARYWDVADGPVEHRWSGPCPPLPRLTAAQLRDASFAFSRRTCRTYDGWHVRHFGLVSDDGLDALAVLLEAIERSSRWPTQTALVTTPMIGKPRGGHRLVGKLAALYRVWAKARRPVADAWEAEHDQSFFAAAAGSGPADAVFRQALRQEAAGAAGRVAVTVMEDMEAFYETIDRDVLLAEAAALGFPTCVVRACLAAYAAPRMVSHGSAVAREVFATRGIIAGCAFATSLVKVFYLRRLRQAKAEMPRGAVLDAYIDDVAIAAEGPRRKVISTIVEAYAVLKRALTRDLRCTLAPQKAAVVSSDREVGRAVAAAIGRGGASADAAPNLGIDVTGGGARRRLGRASKRRARFRLGMDRGKKLGALAKVVGRKAVKIFTTGIAPSASYGSEVWGVSDAECLQLRRVAAQAMRPRSRIRSLSMVHLLQGMPTAASEIAVAVQYSRAVWGAVTRRDHALERGMGVSDIRQQWESAEEGIRPELVKYRASAAQRGGRAAPAVARRAWAAVRGPAGATILTFARLGWAMTSAFTVVNCHGNEVVLTKTSPALIKSMLIEATKDAAERYVGHNWAAADGELQGRRVCPDIAVKMIRGGFNGRLNAVQIGAFRAAACGGIYTRSRAKEAGYLVDDICEKCGAEGDSEHHRIYKCPGTKAAVLEHIPAWLYAEGGRASPSSRFWRTGVFPHPEDDWPRPAAEFDAEIVGDLEGSSGLQGWDDPDHGFGGDLFTDGSCQHGPVRGLSRAGCSTVQVDGDGNRIRGLRMPVPGHLPQSSQSGEHVGVAMGRRKAVRRSHIRCDCANVVRATNAPMRLALSPGKKYSGLVLDRYTRLGEAAAETEVSWVKAHRAEDERHDLDTRRDVRANAAADALAGEAVGMHPQPTAEQKASLEFYLRRAPMVARAVGVALALFQPSEPQRLRRRERPPDDGAEAREEGHQWVHCQGLWRCDKCGTWARSDSLTARHRTERCRGHMADKGAGEWASKGHKIAFVEGDAPFAFCVRCGAWGSRRAYNLSRPCQEPTQAGSIALKRIAMGRHPWRRKVKGGGEAPRARVSVVAAFDGATGKWRRGGGRTRRAPAGGSGGGPAPPSSVSSGRPAVRTQPPAVAEDDAVGWAEPIEEWEPLDHCDEDPFGHGGSLCQDAPSSSAGGVTRAAPSGHQRLSAVRDRVRARLAGGVGVGKGVTDGNSPTGGHAADQGAASGVGAAVGLAGGGSAACADPACSSALRLRAEQVRGADARRLLPAAGAVGSATSHPRVGMGHRYDTSSSSAVGELRHCAAVAGAVEEHGRRGQPGFFQEHRGEHVLHLWGDGSRCSVYPTKARPPSLTDEERGEVADLDGSVKLAHSPTAHTSGSQLQELRHRAVDDGLETALSGSPRRLVGARGVADGDGVRRGHEREGGAHGGPGLRGGGRADRGAGGRAAGSRVPRRAAEGGSEEEATGSSGEGAAQERKRPRLRYRRENLGSDVGEPAAGDPCVHPEAGVADNLVRDAQGDGRRARLQPERDLQGRRRAGPGDAGGCRDGRGCDKVLHADPLDAWHRRDVGHQAHVMRGQRGVISGEGYGEAGHVTVHPGSDVARAPLAWACVDSSGTADERAARTSGGEHHHHPHRLPLQAGHQGGVHGREHDAAEGGKDSGVEAPPRHAPRSGDRGEPPARSQSGDDRLPRGEDAGEDQGGDERQPRPLHGDIPRAAPTSREQLLRLLSATGRSGGGGVKRLVSEPPTRDDPCDKKPRLCRGVHGGNAACGNGGPQEQDRKGANEASAAPLTDHPHHHHHDRLGGYDGQHPDERHRGGATARGQAATSSAALGRGAPVWPAGSACGWGGAVDSRPAGLAHPMAEGRGVARDVSRDRRHHLRDSPKDCDVAGGGGVGAADDGVQRGQPPVSRAQLIRILSRGERGGAAHHHLRQRSGHDILVEHQRPRHRQVDRAAEGCGHTRAAQRARSGGGTEVDADRRRTLPRGGQGHCQEQEPSLRRDNAEVEPHDPEGSSRVLHDLTHHHHHDHALHSVHEDLRHYQHARHKPLASQLRPRHHEAELESADAHHIGRGYYGGRDSSPAIPCKPNLAAHGLEESR